MCDKVVTKVGVISVGDRIRILHMEDPYTPVPYDGKEGEVTFIDSLGQLFGTWGGLAVIPEKDDFEVINGGRS